MILSYGAFQTKINDFASMANFEMNAPPLTELRSINFQNHEVVLHFRVWNLVNPGDTPVGFGNITFDPVSAISQDRNG